MELRTPIPDNADFRDPVWAPHFMQLANAFVLFGAKPKLITRYTGLAPKAIVERYLKLRGENPPHGRMQQTLAKTYATPSNRGSLPWTLQAAAFANIYRKLQTAYPRTTPINDGWMLAKAFETYTTLIEKQGNTDPRLGLSITNAYDIKNYLNAGDLALLACQDCGASYLILTDAELDGQNCPMCLIQKRYAMLVDNSAAISASRQAIRG